MDPSNQQSYSIRELDHYFKDMRDTIAEMNFDVKEVKSQTQKTNGRVNKHDWQIKAFWWALGIFWSVILVLGPAILKFIKYEIDQTVHQSLRQALGEYNIVVK